MQALKSMRTKIRLAEIDKAIEDLLSKVVGANTNLMEYINNKVEALDAELRKLQEKNLSLT